MLTLTSSQAAAAASETCEPRILVEIDTGGGTMRFAEELVTWSGVDYTARLLNAGALTATIEGTGAAVYTPRRFTVELANADGWASRQRPSYWRNRTVRVKQVFLDVESDAVRTQTYVVAGMSADGVKATLTCEDALSPVLSLPVPSQRITAQRFSGVAGLPAEGQPIPLVYGRCYVPLLLIESNSYAHRYIAGAGVCSLSGAVVELDPVTREISQITSPYTVGIGFSVTAPYTLTTRTVDGVTFSEVLFDGMARIAYAAEGRYADITGPLGGNVTPAQVLADLLTNQAGANQPAGTFVDSDTLVTAHSAAVGMGLYVDAALTTALPLERVLGALAQDGLIRALPGASLRLSMQCSRSVVASFCPANILDGTFTVEDQHNRATETQRIVRYTERAWPPVTLAEVAYVVQSGSTVEQAASFLGRRTSAMTAARIGAQEAAYGARRYRFATALKPIAVEPGDLVSLTHSLAALSAQQCEVLDAVYETSRIAWTLRELPTVALDGANMEADQPFWLYTQRIPYNQGSRAANVALSFTSSHQLGRTPIRATEIAILGNLCTASLVSATDSTWTCVTVSSLSSSYRWETILRGWDLSVR